MLLTPAILQLLQQEIPKTIFIFNRFPKTIFIFIRFLAKRPDLELIRLLVGTTQTFSACTSVDRTAGFPLQLATLPTCSSIDRTSVALHLTEDPYRHTRTDRE